MNKKRAPLTGADLRRIRRLHDLRQADIAAQAGITGPMLSLIERDRRRLTPQLEIALTRALWPGSR